MASLVIRGRQKRHKMRFIPENDDDMVVKSLSVPPGLEALMEGLTKEVLRNQPQDICLFASEHFAKLCKMRDSAGEEYKFCKTTIHEKNKKNIPTSQKSHPKDDVEMLDADNSLTVPLLDLGRLSATSISPEIKFNRSEASTAEIDKIQNGFFHSAANFINVAQVAGRVFVNSPNLTDNKEDIDTTEQQVHDEESANLVEEIEAIQENNELVSEVTKETEAKVQEHEELSALISKEANLDEEIEDKLLDDEAEAIQENNELVAEEINNEDKILVDETDRQEKDELVTDDKETEANKDEEIKEATNIEDKILVDESDRQEKDELVSDDKETEANIGEETNIKDKILADETDRQEKDELVTDDKETEANISEEIKEAINIEDKILVDEDKDEFASDEKETEANITEEIKEVTNIEDKILVDETDKDEKDELRSEDMKDNKAALVEESKEETFIEDNILVDETAELQQGELVSGEIEETNANLAEELINIASEEIQIEETKASDNSEENEAVTAEEESQNEVLNLAIEDSAADLSELLDEVDIKLSTEDESELTTETVIQVPENLEEISEIELADEKLENENLQLTEEIQNETSQAEELAVDIQEDNIEKLAELISEEKITEEEELIKLVDTTDRLDEETDKEDISNTTKEEIKAEEAEELKETVEIEQNKANIEEIQKQENNLETSEETLKEAIEVQEETSKTNDIKNELLTDEEKIEDNFEHIAENVITAESIIDKIGTDNAIETPEIINTEVKLEEEISENLDETKENEEHDRKKRSIDNEDFSKLPIPKISTTNATPTPSEEERDSVDHSIKEPTLLGVPAEEEYDEAKLNKSALLIQSIWRAYNIRKLNKSLKALEEKDNDEIGKENIAATLIQSLWRGHNTRKQNLVPQTAKEEIRVVAIEEIIAATKLQSVWRGFATRKAMKSNAPSQTSIDNEEKEDEKIEGNMVVSSEKEATTFEEILAAVKLQSVWRGFATRKEIKSQVSKIEESPQNDEVSTIEEIVAATKLQSVWRGYNTRKAMKTNTADSKPEISSEETKLDDVMKDINAAIKIQSIWRGFKSRKLQNLDIKDSENEKQTLANIVDGSKKEILAATLIQSLWRGHLIRKDKNINDSSKFVNEEIMKQAIAATLIQSLWRGHTIRKNKKIEETDDENVPVTEEIVHETAVHLENVQESLGLEQAIVEKIIETLDEVVKEDKSDLEAVLTESIEEAQTNASDASPEVILGINEEQTGEMEPQTIVEEIKDIDNQAANENIDTVDATEEIKKAIGQVEEETAIVETIENDEQTGEIEPQTIVEEIKDIDNQVANANLDAAEEIKEAIEHVEEETAILDTVEGENDEENSNDGKEEKERLVEVADALNDTTNEDKEELNEGEIITSTFDIVNNDLTKLEVAEPKLPVIDDAIPNLEEETDTSVDTANILVDTKEHGEKNDLIKEVELEDLEKQIITEEDIEADVVHIFENKLEEDKITGEELTEPGIIEEHAASDNEQEETILKQIIAATKLQSAWRGYNYRNTNKVDKTEEPQAENNEDKEKVSENTTENLKILESVLENTDNSELASEHQQLEDDSVVNITEPINQNLNLKTEEFEHQISTIEDNEPTNDNDIQSIDNQEDSKSTEDKEISENQEESSKIEDTSETDNNITDTKDVINTVSQDPSAIEEIQIEKTSEAEINSNDTQNKPSIKDEIYTESTIISLLENDHDKSNINEEINKDNASSENRSTEAQTATPTIEEDIKIETTPLEETVPETKELMKVEEKIIENNEPVVETQHTNAQDEVEENIIALEQSNNKDEPVKEEIEVIETIGNINDNEFTNNIENKNTIEDNEEAKVKDEIPEEKLDAFSSEKPDKSENAETEDELSVDENNKDTNKIEDTPSFVEEIECESVENNPVHEEIISQNIIENLSPINDEITGTKEENMIPISALVVIEKEEKLNSTEAKDETETNLKESQDQSEGSVHATDNENTEFKNTKDPFEESEASTIDIKDIEDFTQSIDSIDQNVDSKILDEPFEQFPSMKQTPLRRMSSNLELLVHEASENLNESSIKVNEKLKGLDASLDSLSEEKVTFFIGPNKDAIIAVSDSEELADNEEGNTKLVDDAKLNSEGDTDTNIICNKTEDENKENTLDNLTDAIDNQAKLSSEDAGTADINNDKEEIVANTPTEIQEANKEDSTTEEINSTSNPVDLTNITVPEVNKIEDSTNNLIPSDISEISDNIKVASEKTTDELNNILKEEHEKPIIDKVNEELDEIEALNLRLQNLSRTDIYRSESPEEESNTKIEETDNTLKDSKEGTVANVHDENDNSTIPGTVETDTTNNTEDTQTSAKENSELGKNIESFDKALLEITEPIILRSYVDNVIIDKNEETKDDGLSSKDETVEQLEKEESNSLTVEPAGTIKGNDYLENGIHNGKETKSSDVHEDSMVEEKQENDEIINAVEATENKTITMEDVEPNIEENNDLHSTKIGYEEETADNSMQPEDSVKKTSAEAKEEHDDKENIEKDCKNDVQLQSDSEKQSETTTNDSNKDVNTIDIVNNEENNKDQTVLENESIIVETGTTEDDKSGNMEDRKLNENITEESEYLEPSIKEDNKGETILEKESTTVEAATLEDKSGNMEDEKLNEHIKEKSEYLEPSLNDNNKEETIFDKESITVEAVTPEDKTGNIKEEKPHIKEEGGHLKATDQSTLENINNEIHNQAAVKIQSAWRGHNTRKAIEDQKELAELQKPAECDEMSEQKDIISKAATTIQAGARGYLVRKRRNAPTFTPQENSSLTIDESADNISVASMVTVIEKPILSKSPEKSIEENQIKQSTEAAETEENNNANEDDLELATDTKATSIIPENEDNNHGKVSKQTEQNHSDDQDIKNSTKEETSAELDEMEALNLRLQNLSRSNVYRSDSPNEETLDSNTSSRNNTPTHKIESSLAENIVNDPIAAGEDNQNEETKKEHINVLTQPEPDSVSENPVVSNEPRRSVNFDEIDIDSSKYDLKVDQHSPRSKNSSPVHELSTAALKISAAITGEDDSIADALEEKDEKKEAVEEKAVEYIHIPLQGPIPEVTQRKMDAVKEKKSDTDSPDYIYIPLRDPGTKEEIETKSNNDVMENVNEIQSEETPLAITNTEHLNENSINDLSTTIEENTDISPAEDTDASKEGVKDVSKEEIIESQEAEPKTEHPIMEDTAVEDIKEENDSNEDINNKLVISDIDTLGNITPINSGTVLKENTTEKDLKAETEEKKNIVVEDTKEDAKEDIKEDAKDDTKVDTKDDTEEDIKEDTEEKTKEESNKDSSETDTLGNITPTTSETHLIESSPKEDLIEETKERTNGSAKSPRTKSSIDDIDAYLERNRQRTITRQENVESSGRRKLFDEIDSIIECYGQKREMTPTSDLEPLKIGDESSGQGQQLFDDLATVPNVIIPDNSDAAATKIQSAFRGFRTRQELKINKDIDLDKRSIATERRNSLGSDKTYTVARSPTNISTPEEVSSDEETVKNLAASKIQKSYRNYRNKQKSLDEEDLKNVAATKIQESYKKYRHKRSLSLTPVGKENFPDIHQVPELKISDLEDKFLDYPSGSPRLAAHEELKDISEISNCAATKIQSTYRGFKTRQGLQNNNESDLDTIPEIVSPIATNTTVEHVISAAGLKDGHEQLGRLMNEEVSAIQNKINGHTTKINTDSSHHYSSYENETNHFSVKSGRYDSDGGHSQLVSDEATDEEMAKESTTSTTSGIRSESSIYDEDESESSDAKSSADVRIGHQVAQGYDADTENKTGHGNRDNPGPGLGPGLQHSAEMHDSVDIFLSSEELSQGAEVLTSREPKTDERGDDNTGGRSIIVREA